MFFATKLRGKNRPAIERDGGSVKYAQVGET